MKKVFLCCIIALSFLSHSVAQERDRTPVKLRVGTYNVGHFNQGMKGGYEPKGKRFYPNKNSTTDRYIQKELLNWKKWIGEQSMDIFFVQEWNQYFDQDSTYNAADELLKPYYNNLYFGKAHTWIFNGIATNYHLQNIRTQYWYEDYYALIGDLKLGDITVQVISTHIPWQAAGHKKALEAIKNELKKYEYFICAGDFNAKDDAVLSFKEAGFNIANGGHLGWFATSRTVILDCMQDAPDRHIDNTITSSNIKIMNVSAPTTGLNDLDHLPLLADIIITK